MHHVLLLGAGKIGTAIAKFLAHTGDFDVLVGDVDERAVRRLENVPNVRATLLDSSSTAELEKVMRGRQSVISALNYTLNPGVAKAALKSGCSYFDLTEDVDTTRVVKDVAKQAKSGQIFMPQCGLAPGFVSIAAHHLTRDFDKLD